LMSATLVAGSGIAATPGSLLTVSQTELLTSSLIFDSSNPGLNPGQDMSSLTLGLGIAGWNQGLLGIKPGETRVLFIPATLAYGASANGAIPANASLICTFS